MNPTPPSLHQRQPLPLPAAALSRQRDRFSYFQGYNLLACLLLVGSGLLAPSATQFCAGLAFAAVWVYGIFTPDAQQHRFFLASVFLWLVLPLLLAFHLIH